MTQRRAFTNRVFASFVWILESVGGRREDQPADHPSSPHAANRLWSSAMPSRHDNCHSYQQFTQAWVRNLTSSSYSYHHNSHCHFTQAWVRDPLPVDSVGLPVFIFPYARDTAGNVHHIYHINQKNSILYNKSEQRHSAFAIHIIMWAWYYGYIISNQVTSVFQRVLHK